MPTMRPGHTLAALLVAALTLLAVGAASADRKATNDERRAIAKEVDLPTKCAKVRISTVTESTEWASVYWKPRPEEKCMPYARDGVAVLRLKKSDWRFVTAGSDFTCNGLYKDVPREVVRDLDIPCR